MEREVVGGEGEVEREVVGGGEAERMGWLEERPGGRGGRGGGEGRERREGGEVLLRHQ